MKQQTIWMFLASAALATAPLAAVPPPDLINYQGVLRDANAAPLNGSFDMEFAFYEVPTGGSLLLLDEHLSTGTGDVVVTGGLFNVHLGGGGISGTYASLAELFRGHGDVFLEVRVEGQTLVPRTRIVSGAYAHNAPQGVLYVRWGRNDCPAGRTLVYSGYATSGHTSHTGGPSNQLCLASTIDEDGLGVSSGDQNGSLLYGTEYNTTSYGVSFPAGLNDDDAPCALCLQPAADAQFMYPGSAVCPSGWTTEYKGYLMGAHYQNASPRESVCVDELPHSTPESAPLNDDQHAWYPTEGECGSLPCPPYQQDREIVCSVCTR